MDWFERITGFRETSYDETRSKLSVVDGRLHSTHSHRTCAVGELETPALAELRQRAEELITGQGSTTVTCLRGDVRHMHRDSRNAGAVFQVASQFNLLEMVGPSVTPEHGVTRYETDATQGPACAIAAGAGTIYRNYFAPVQGFTGQRHDWQIDCLQDVGALLGNADGSLWQMRNGYCLVTEESLARIDAKLALSDAVELRELAGRLRIGWHANVEVTDQGAGHLVNQAYCSALPVAYNRVRQRAHWARFAELVLEAAYEATLLSAAFHRKQGVRPVVYLTRLGGGAFGNDAQWITSAIRRALLVCRDAALDVRLVSYGDPELAQIRLAAEFPG